MCSSWSQFLCNNNSRLRTQKCKVFEKPYICMCVWFYFNSQISAWTFILAVVQLVAFSIHSLNRAMINYALIYCFGHLKLLWGHKDSCTLVSWSPPWFHSSSLNLLSFQMCVGLTWALCSTDVGRTAGWDEEPETGMVVPVWFPCEMIEDWFF